MAPESQLNKAAKKRTQGHMSRTLGLIPQAASWAHRLDPGPIQSMAQLQRCPQVPSSLGHEGLDIVTLQGRHWLNA